MPLVDTSPLESIAALLADCQPQVERIVAAVLSCSALPQEIASLRETTELLDERLAALVADEADCSALLTTLDGDAFDRLPAFDGLDADEALDMRQALRRRLQAHRTVLQNHQGTLQRGIELGRTGLVNRFATFAVAGLGEDGAPSLPSGLAFLVACQVASQLKDRLESAGYRWAGEKTLVTLYLHAIGCERRQTPDRQVADPAASVIATRLGFRSARELHQALAALHDAQRATMDAAEAEDAATVTSGTAHAQSAARLGHVQFDRAPCAAFDERYGASRLLEETFLRVMARARTGPSPN